MKTNIHVWSHLAQFFLEWEMFRTKVVEEIKTHILCPLTFFFKSCCLWDNVGKYCRNGEAASDVRCMRMACCITKATHTHTHTHTVHEYGMLSLFHCNNNCTNAPQRYIIRTLPLLFRAIAWHCHVFVPFNSSSWCVVLQKHRCRLLYLWETVLFLSQAVNILPN
jgi:hypothetical protein